MRGDRHYEYQWAGSHLRKAAFPGEPLLDVGPGTRAKMAKYAISQGWFVTAVDLMPCDFRHKSFQFWKGDLRTVPLAPVFGAVLCVSSIEHFGLAGRYDVETAERDADLGGMQVIRNVCGPETDVIVTIPVGVDAVLSPFHRIYGYDRIEKLFDGFDIIEAQHYTKRGGVDEYQPCKMAEALTTEATLEPAHFAALGCYVLRRT